MAAPQLTLAFDPEAHEYHLAGECIPSVTQILGFGKDRSRIPRYTALFGTLVHKACELDSLGDLDEESLVAQEIDGRWCDPWPRLRAWRSHRAQRERHGWSIIYTEIAVWGEIDGLRYAGTVDVVWSDFAVKGEETRAWVDDLKTGQPRPAEHGPQVQAYKHAYQQQYAHEVVSAGCIYLGDGRCERKPYDEPEHFEKFRDALHRYYEAMEGK